MRAIFRHGFLDWMHKTQPDVVCLQETRSPTDLTDDLLHPLGYRSYWHHAERKGYSGVATYTRAEPGWVLEGIGVPEVDEEGRVLTTEFPGFNLVNAYFPNSQSDHSRLDYKLEFCSYLLRFLGNLKKRGKHVILCGDFNIAHRDIDVHSPEHCVNLNGFLPEERAWMDRLLAAGFVDVFRAGCPDPGQYTWWSYTPKDRPRNLGWRIDYFIADVDFAGLGPCVIQSDVTGADHCPVVLDVPDS